MNNFPVNVNGKEYWISRSVAVAINVYAHINGEDCVLANKRGPGLPNHVGEWNCISGYIDYDETLLDACKREVFEETGVDIKNCSINFVKYEDDPKRENQVILFRFCTWCNNPREQVLTNKNCEPNEVDEIKWIPISEVDNYTWTSIKHREMIKEIYKKFYEIYK